jgi:hypothetical protein
MKFPVYHRVDFEQYIAQAGFAIYPSLGLKVVKNGNSNREGYIPP